MSCDASENSRVNLAEYIVLVLEDLHEAICLFRDDGVKKACTKMLATKWINQADDNLIEFLERLDVMGSSVAEDVLNAFFDYRADVIDTLSFNGK